MKNVLGNRRKPFENFWIFWVFYLIFPFSSILSRPNPQRWIGFTLLAVFVALVLLGFKDGKRRILYILVLFILITGFSLTYSPYLVFMFFYTIPIIGMIAQNRSFYAAVALLLINVSSIVWLNFIEFYNASSWYIFPTLVVLIFLPFGIRSRQKANELREKLMLANDEIARLAMIEERQRISRDLHDTLGHTLSLITLKSELAERLILKAPERAVQEVKDIQATSRAALKQVRELISGMNAISLSDEITQSKAILQAASIAFDSHAELGKLQAPPMVHNILGMCLREAVTNVIKHSGATRCTFSLKEQSGYWVMTIADNGKGCENKAGVDPVPSSGRGLLGMQERLELIDGKMTFHKGTEAGTMLTIQVPIIIKHQSTEQQLKAASAESAGEGKEV
ncbi:sensor histidine kinase [Paenibacillus aestuarii]|uniref:histidine kinase n=1 Tax=Paenibacillus aestuarii TaxID=516965 RepID=A0ABW0KAG4_9BACL|nr:sensor histidine kinase [Paenibacillus aestuarii]